MSRKPQDAVDHHNPGSHSIAHSVWPAGWNGFHCLRVEREAGRIKNTNKELMYFVLPTAFSLAVGQLEGKLDRVWRTRFRVLVVAGFCVTLLVRTVALRSSTFAFHPKELPLWWQHFWESLLWFKPSKNVKKRLWCLLRIVWTTKCCLWALSLWCKSAGY